METRRLGRTGLPVSTIGLGTMTWGRDTDADEAAGQLRAFLSAGGTLVDTANRYADGDSETVLGGMLTGSKPVCKRSDLILATKAGAPVGAGERETGGSRDHLLRELDGSLKRLGTDHVDLWQLHRFDALTPLEETLSALDAAVNTGRARYVGISNFSGWQTAQATTWQRSFPGRATIASTQMEYSLLQRGVEREVVPAALDAGVGILAWSPLGRGVLTGKYRNGVPADSRGATPHLQPFVAPYLQEPATGIVDAVLTAADGLGVAPLGVALAWVRGRPGVVSAIVGCRTTAQLMGVLAADDVVLPAAIIAALDDVSAPAMGYPEVQ